MEIHFIKQIIRKSGLAWVVIRVAYTIVNRRKNQFTEKTYISFNGSFVIIRLGYLASVEMSMNEPVIVKFKQIFVETL